MVVGPGVTSIGRLVGRLIGRLVGTVKGILVMRVVPSFGSVKGTDRTDGKSTVFEPSPKGNVTGTLAVSVVCSLEIVTGSEITGGSSRLVGAIIMPVFVLEVFSSPWVWL